MNRLTPRGIVLLVLSCSVVVLSGCNPGESGAETAEATTPFVEVVEAEDGAVPLVERVSGIVKAENQVAIRPEISAPIVEVLVRNGESVSRGQVLVRLDASVLASQVREAEAAERLAAAEADEQRARVREIEARVERFRSLAGEKLVSAQDLETLEAQLAAARASAAQSTARVDQAAASLAEARRELERAIVRAPISGKVGRRDAEVGMIAGPANVLFVIGNLDELIIEVPLTEEMLGHVREGQAVRIHSDVLEGGSMDATLTRISPFLESSSFSTVGEIEIRDPGGRLQPGMFVRVDLLYGESDRATIVPTSAVWEDPDDGELVAWVVSDSKSVAGESATRLERRKVGVIGEGHLAVAVSGVRPDEWVVVIGQHLLSGETTQARLRATTRERVEALQRLQREDLLESYLAKQQRLAKELGPRPMTNEAFLGSSAGDEKPTGGGI